MPHSFSAALCFYVPLGFLHHLFSAKKKPSTKSITLLEAFFTQEKTNKKRFNFFFKERGKHPILFVKKGCSPPTKDMFKSSTVDGRNPARLGMYKTLLMVG